VEVAYIYNQKEIKMVKKIEFLRIVYEDMIGCVNYPDLARSIYALYTGANKQKLTKNDKMFLNEAIKNYIMKLDDWPVNLRNNVIIINDDELIAHLSQMPPCSSGIELADKYIFHLIVALAFRTKITPAIKLSVRRALSLYKELELNSSACVTDFFPHLNEKTYLCSDMVYDVCNLAVLFHLGRISLTNKKHSISYTVDIY